MTLDKLEGTQVVNDEELIIGNGENTDTFDEKPEDNGSI